MAIFPMILLTLLQTLGMMKIVIIISYVMITMVTTRLVTDILTICMKWLHI